MKVLVIGKGGREHAILSLLQKSTKIKKLFCLPGNGATAAFCENVPILEFEYEKILNFVEREKIDFVVVTPDNQLADGLVDLLQEKNIACFGPTKNAALIESSKIFAKNLMKKYNIPTAKFEVFREKEKALEFLESNSKFPIVVKADGLAFGKGVVVAKNLKQAKEAVENMMEKEMFKQSGKKIVIEEFLEGIEVSVMAFTDGKTIKPLISSLDHKRAQDGDNGLNTGGMGAVAPNLVYTKEIAKICEEKIFWPTINAMKKENRTFKGCLYFGLIITKDGPKVIEYNSRFGDPETQVVLPLLKTDLFSIFLAVAENKLDQVKIEFLNKTCACVVLASKGYPEKYETGFEVDFSNLKDSKIKIFHSGTILKDGKIITSSGRVLSVCSVADDLKTALENVYDAVEKINFKNKYYRKDIGAKLLNLNFAQSLN